MSEGAQRAEHRRRQLDRRQHLVGDRPLAVEQQPDDAVVAAVRGKIADLVSAVEQPSGLSVDQADRRLGGEMPSRPLLTCPPSAASVSPRPTGCTGPGVRQCSVKLSAKADYAVRAVLVLAAHDDPEPLEGELIAGARSCP